MRELSIEEKAKRYDEAIELARQIHDADRVSGIELTTCEDIFPELKESEDERIRKEIIDFATKANNGFTSILANNYNFNKWLAWLEKQGEQPKKHDVCDNCDQQGCCVSPCPMKLVEKHGEQNKVEQKFHEGERIVYECGEETAWLKSLKGRVQPQPKQEWSEEDESRIITICTYLQDYARLSGSELRTTRINEYCDWLKSLRPQNRWKPSDEQINALEKECIAHSNYELCRLLEQLKKLREK